MPAWSCGWTACQSTLGVLLERVLQFSFFPEDASACALWLLGDVRQSTVSGMVGTFAS